jgi:capsular polysaccharide biosynthesis protein
MNELNSHHVNEDEIDLLELLKKIYTEKKFIIKSSIISVVLGVLFALIQPNQYTSSTTFIPQLSTDAKAGGSSLSGLASLAGINLGGVEGSSEFPPTLYPQVIESVPFRLKLLSSSVNINNETKILSDYILSEKSFNLVGAIKKYTIGLPSLIVGIFRAEDSTKKSLSEIYSISEDDKLLFDHLENNLSLSVNDKEGFITMSFTDKNKNVAAQIANSAQSLLQDRIIEFKVKSSKELLDFTIEQYNQKKYAFEALQDERAIFVDKNINISSSLYQNKLNRIESELSIAQSVVQQLATQVEQAKLKVNKDTPVFTTIKPVSVPYEKSAPSRSLMVIIFLFIGLILSAGYILIKDNLFKIYSELKS